MTTASTETRLGAEHAMQGDMRVRNEYIEIEDTSSATRTAATATASASARAWVPSRR